MFIKLNKNIHVSEYTPETSVISYVGKIEYLTVSIPSDDVLLMIPERYRDKFVVLVMELTGPIGSHTDSGILSTINIYVEPDNCITKFYDFPKDTEVDIMQVKNQTNGKVFKTNQLVFHGSFVANKDEAWLLDVTKPHSVHSNKEESSPSVNRTAIAVQSKHYSYEQVQEMLTETGYL
jgi:hypothetical protein